MKDSKRSRLYIYGEKTEVLTIQVPGSKKEEIRGKFYELLKGYENPAKLSLNNEPSDKKVISDIVEEQKDNSEQCFGVAISALPKDKKQISVGLYSSGGKFYTNKIVSNQLVILEWGDLDSAKLYLDNLKK